MTSPAQKQRPPHNVPLLIAINGKAIDRPMTLPRHQGLLDLMGKYEWGLWPETQEVEL